MKLSKLVLYSAGAFVAVAAIGALTSPKLAAAIRAAYVEVVVPSQPYYGSAVLFNTGPVAVGPGTGTLGITNITLTNLDSVAHQVSMDQISNGSAGPCNTPATSQVNLRNVTVQPNSTLVIPFPTPWVLSNMKGQTCMGASAYGDAGSNFTLEMDVTGFVN